MVTASEGTEAVTIAPASPGSHPSDGVPRRRLLLMGLGTAVGGAAALVARPSAARAAGLSLLDSTTLSEPATSTRPDVAADWFELMETSLPVGPPPGTDGRVRAISWLSALLALRTRSAGGLTSRQRSRFEDAAVVTAVHDVLVALLPPDQTGPLDRARDASLGAIPDGAGKQAGIEAGQAAAAATLRDREGDGLDLTSINRPYTPPPPAPGVYRLPPGATATQGAGLGEARPFLLGRADRFRPPAPPGLDSDVYLRGLEELRRFGVKEGSLRSDRQRDIAWLAPGMQYMPALRALIRQPGRSLPWKVGLLAAYSATSVDAQIAVSEAKFTYLHWRPVTAIREGSRFTPPDESWESYLGTPPNPEYPSGHGAGAGAAERVLEHFAGHRTPVSFTATYTRGDDGGVVNLEYPRGTRWSVLTQENVDARVWAGVHWRSSDEAGATLGRRVADYGLRQLGTR